ncbi:MAG: hypothetical protein V4484_18400 [Pseudomonadota bacterium]
MQSQAQYKGYAIDVTPLRDCGDLWDFTYRITRDGHDAVITRSQSVGGHATAEAACLAGLQVARIEIDNLLALAASGSRSSP